MSNVHFSSKSDNWATPDDFFDMIVEKYGPFDVDVCASPDNAKCSVYYTKEQDGLKQMWSGKCWMNPPYGREIGKWVEKAALSKAKVVALLPARTDTKWFHKYIYKKESVEIQFLMGRLKFGNASNSAPFPSMLVIFNKGEKSE